MKKRMVALLAGAILMMAAGSALATPIVYTPNDRSPAVVVATPETTQKSLQTVFNELTGTLSNDKKSVTPSSTNIIDARRDQSTYGAWSTTDFNSTAYRVALVSQMASGTLGITSLANGTSVNLFTASLSGGLNATFDFRGGDLYVNNSLKSANFGNSYAFYWKDSYSTQGQHVSSTMDSLNGDNARALTYQVKNGTVLNIDPNINTTTDKYLTSIADGNNDWILAFDNYFTKTTGVTELYTNDFNDAVFFVKDMNPVPEPGTMMLLGIGMLGLAVYGKRRMNKEA